MAPEDRQRRRRGRSAEAKVDAPPAPEPEVEDEAAAVPVEPAETARPANGQAETAAPEASPEPETPAAEPVPEVEAEAAPEPEPPAAEAAPEPLAPAVPVAEPEIVDEVTAATEPAPPPVVPAPEVAPEVTPTPEPAAEPPAWEPPVEEAPPPLPTHTWEEVVPGGLYERWWATGLPNVGTIAARELGALFVSPVGYVTAVLAMAFVGTAGYLSPVLSGQAVLMDQVFYWLTIVMAVFIPLHTMRLLAEERRSGTLEILVTSPVRDWELVLGKWLAGFAFFLATIAFTLVFVVLLSIFQPLQATATILGVQLSLPALDYGTIVAGYVGIVLLGAAWVAIGLLVSSITSHPIVAALVGIVSLLALLLLLQPLGGVLSAPVGDLLQYLSNFNRFQSFNQGQIFVRDVVYFLSLTVAALFVTTRVVESRKWR